MTTEPNTSMTAGEQPSFLPTGDSPQISRRTELTAEQRDYLRRKVDRRRRTVECLGCGAAIIKTSERRRYCSRACANRHWHVRRAGDVGVPA